jgi:hypothetical protein
MKYDKSPSKAMQANGFESPPARLQAREFKAEGRWAKSGAHVRAGHVLSLIVHEIPRYHFVTCALKR